MLLKNIIIGVILAMVCVFVILLLFLMWVVGMFKRRHKVPYISRRSSSSDSPYCTSLVSEEDDKCDKKRCNSFIYDWVINKYRAFKTYGANCKVNIKQCENCPHRAYSGVSGQIGTSNWVHVGRGQNAYNALKINRLLSYSRG